MCVFYFKHPNKTKKKKHPPLVSLNMSAKALNQNILSYNAQGKIISIALQAQNIKVNY